MALYNLIGYQRCHNVTNAVLLSAEKLHVNVLLFHFSTYIFFFLTVLIGMNVNISNELSFSKVCQNITTLVH